MSNMLHRLLLDYRNRVKKQETILHTLVSQSANPSHIIPKWPEPVYHSWGKQKKGFKTTSPRQRSPLLLVHASIHENRCQVAYYHGSIQRDTPKFTIKVEKLKILLSLILITSRWLMKFSALYSRRTAWPWCSHHVEVHLSRQTHIHQTSSMATRDCSGGKRLLQMEGQRDCKLENKETGSGPCPLLLPQGLSCRCSNQWPKMAVHNRWLQGCSSCPSSVLTGRRISQLSWQRKN